MPRPRKNDPTSLIAPLLRDFANAIAQQVERSTLQRVHAEFGRALDAGFVGRVKARARRPTAFCYYPGCKNVAAPRFSMFCAAAHKGISVADKKKYRARHAAEARR